MLRSGLADRGAGRPDRVGREHRPRLHERRGDVRSSVGLAIVILIGTVNTFLPPGYGMWTTATPYFDQPWFYIVGVAVSAIAIYNLVLLLRFPPR